MMHPPRRFARLWNARPRVDALIIVLLANAWLLAAFNRAFWTRSYAQMPEDEPLFALFVVGIFALGMVYLLALCNRWTLKPVLIANIFIAAGASYFNDTMGIVIDEVMIQNIALTTAREAHSLFSWPMLRYLLTFAVIPSAVLLLLRVRYLPMRRAALLHSGALVLCGLVFAAIAAPNYQFYSFSLKQSPGLRKVLHPIGPVRSAIDYAGVVWTTQNLPFRPIALDARKAEGSDTADRPRLLVLMVGETLRDANWGLSGYTRNTTPELARRDVLPIADVAACGTSTVISLPCMFSPYTRENFTYEKATNTENLLDVLKRAGFDVEWWDANTGDMGVAERVPYTNYNHVADSPYCTEVQCNDGILLEKLAERSGTITHDTVIVLHQIGNHGPSYYERYPREFARYLPDCRRPDVANCSAEAVVNAYDNAIAYTDLIMAKIIDYLDGLEEVDPALLFASDHGESLGENGLYLHALPYWFAPKEQTEVPMLLWLSERFRQDTGMRYDCVREVAGEGVSHDNFFHSVLGLLDVDTTIRDDTLNLFRTCQSHSM